MITTLLGTHLGNETQSRDFWTALLRPRKAVYSLSKSKLVQCHLSKIGHFRNPFSKFLCAPLH